MTHDLCGRCHKETEKLANRMVKTLKQKQIYQAKLLDILMSNENLAKKISINKFSGVATTPNSV